MSERIPDWLHQLLRLSLDGVYVFDREFRISYWNDALHKIYGLLREEVQQQSVFKVLPFLAETDEGEALRQTLAGRSRALNDCAYSMRSTGCSGYTESHYSPLVDELGAAIGGIAVIRDITARKLEETRVRETELRFHSMADSSPVLLWMADTTGLCTFFNQTWLRFTGRSLEEEHGVGWAEGIHPFDFQQCMDTYIEHFNRRQPFEMEYRLLRKDGEYRWILDRGAPRHNPDGSFAGFIGSCTDITERKNLESALKQALFEAEAASRVKSEFLANISHELRTPLNAIVNIPQATLRDFPTITVWHCAGCGSDFQNQDDSGAPEDNVAPRCPSCESANLQPQPRPYYIGDAKKTAHFMGRLVQSGQHMLRVVNDLLDFSKLEAGRMQLSLSQVDVATVFDEIAQTLNPLAEDKGVSIYFPSRIETGQIALQADEVKLAQILINLIGNAIKFTPSGGTIFVGVSAESDGDGAVRCFVKDNGIGIPKDKQKLIFESFRQLDGSHTRAHQGTGLGLTITKQLIELHSGKIWLESEVGAGSTFIFSLPRSGPPPGAQSGHAS